MYHIDVNNPPVETACAVLGRASLPSAALITDSSLAANASPESQEANPTRVRLSPNSSLYSYSHSSKVEPLQQAEHENIILAAWNQYQTVNQMRASPYYFCVDLPISSNSTTASTLSSGSTSVHRYITAASGNLDKRAEHVPTDQSLALHSVHPVPIRYLRKLTPKQLEFVYSYLTGKRFRPGSELSRRAYETVRNIERIMHPGEEWKNGWALVLIVVEFLCYNVYIWYQRHCNYLNFKGVYLTLVAHLLAPLHRDL